MRGCNCFSDVNAELAKSNGELLADFFTDPPRVFISTYRRKGRKKLPLVQASFCPFCGEKYPENKIALTKAA